MRGIVAVVEGDAVPGNVEITILEPAIIDRALPEANAIRVVGDRAGGNVDVNCRMNSPLISDFGSTVSSVLCERACSLAIESPATASTTTFCETEPILRATGISCTPPALTAIPLSVRA
jgi:hypothetical protein